MMYSFSETILCTAKRLSIEIPMAKGAWITYDDGSIEIFGNNNDEDDDGDEKSQHTRNYENLFISALLWFSKIKFVQFRPLKIVLRTLLKSRWAGTTLIPFKLIKQNTYTFFSLSFIHALFNLFVQLMGGKWKPIFLQWLQ